MSVKTMDSRRTSSFTRLLIFYFLSVTLASIAFTIQDSLTLGQAAPFHDSFIPFGYPYIYPSLLATLLSVWIMTHFIDRRPFVSVGFPLNFSFPCHILFGFVFAGLFRTLEFYAIAYAQLGGFSVWPFFSNQSASQVLSAAWVFLLAASYEELIFRGYLLQTLVRGLGIAPAILISSFLFGLAHYNLGSWMYVLNDSLIGLLLTIACLRTRSLWFPISFHFSYNLFSWGWPPYLSSYREIDHVIHLLGLVFMTLLLLVLPLRPHPQAKTLWDRYIHPAPFPPWRKPAHASQENSKSQPPMDLSPQHPGRDQDSGDA